MIIIAYRLNQEKIVALVAKGSHGHLIKEWVNSIGREMQKSIENHENEIAFFKRIYPDIKKYKSEIPEIQLKTFRGVFLDKVFETLEIEKFGRTGDMFNSFVHLVVSGQSGMGGNIVKKVIEPGYRRKFNGEVIIKALVEL